MTPIPTACPSCGRPALVPEDAVGRTAACPSCTARYRLESVGDPAPEAASTPATPPAARPEPSPPRPLRLIPAPSSRDSPA